MPPYRFPLGIALMSLFVIQISMKYWHPVQDPPVNKDLNRYNCYDYADFMPRRYDMMEMFRKLPIQCYDRDIEPVQENPDYSIDGSKPDQTHVLFFNSIG